MKFLKTLFIAAMFMSLAACGRIETGYIGVRTDFNKTVQTSPMRPGFYTALFSHVDEYVVKEIEVKFDNLTPKGKDNLVLADFDVSIWYQPTAAKIPEMSIKYTGMSVKDDQKDFYYPMFNLVERTARGAIFDVVSQYDSLTIHTQRTLLEANIAKSVQTELDKSDKGDFFVTKVVVRQIKTDPALEKSIQKAVQMQKQTEAKMLEVKLAQAEAQRVVAEAEGQAKANQILANSLTEQYIKYKQIEMQAQFAGTGTHTILFGNSSNALVSVGK